MPGKRPSVENEQQYEKLKGKREVRVVFELDRLALESARRDRPEEGRRP